jgi:cell division protein FtsB
MAAAQKPGARKPSKRFHWLRWLLLGLLITAAYDVMTGPSGILNLRKMADINADKRADLDSLARRRDALAAEKQRLLSDSSYLEAVARRELGMAKPGEKVYRFERAREGEAR